MLNKSLRENDMIKTRKISLTKSMKWFLFVQINQKSSCKKHINPPKKDDQSYEEGKKQKVEHE